MVTRFLLAPHDLLFLLFFPTRFKEVWYVLVYFLRTSFFYTIITYYRNYSIRYYSESALVDVKHLSVSPIDL